MEKNAFLRELAGILREKGLTDAEVRVRTEKISSFVDGLSPEERNAVIGGTPDVAAIAERLFARDPAIGKRQTPPAQQPVQPTQPQSGRSQGQRRAPDTAPTGRPTPAAASRTGTALKTPSGTDTGNFHITSDYKRNDGERMGGTSGTGKNVAEIRRRDEEKLRKLRSEAQKPKKHHATETRSLSEAYESDRKFWVIFFCSLPILFFLAALVLGVFAVIYSVMVAVILVLVSLMAAAVAVGSALSLIGIFYGLTQFTTSVAIATYEIGMGLVIGGITMLGGILIYNAAIRLIPYLMRLVGRLAKFLWKKLCLLADYLKGVCASL